MPLRARLYITLVVALGALAIANAVIPWQSNGVARFCFYLALSLLASGVKINLPATRGPMPVCFLFTLISVTELSIGETIVIGCAGAVVQCFWDTRRRTRLVLILFRVATTGVASWTAYRLYHWPALHDFGESGPFLIAAAALVYFLASTLPMAAATSLTEQMPLGQSWKSSYLWTLPFYLMGSSVAWTINLFSRRLQWQRSALLLPVVYFIHRAYCMYLDRLAAEKRHVEEMAALHMRTIEALALAIEAKDQTTHEHLRRVRTYAVEVGKEMGLQGNELEALRAAALLHDIGKLAIPEHIISKPGKLTPEEFEKMKIHPVVGAEILERVAFPYPVAPLVRSHHEKWDGTGYPDGLRGDRIPLGARILAAVDCLDALSTDRQYRRALPLDEAMRHVISVSGASLDPAVVAVLARRYTELEEMAQTQCTAGARLSRDLKIARGNPAAGFDVSQPDGTCAKGYNFLSSIAAARQEVQLLFELTQDLGSSLSLDETLSVVAIRLRKMVPYDAIALYLCHADTLVPQYVGGENYRLFSSLRIPLGEGISGWVAQHRKSIVNGNPSVECGYLHDPARFSTLGSALAVPLEGLNGLIGVLTLYRAGRDAFSRDHLRILQAITSKVSLSIENALRFRLAEDSATTDCLTGLPNARSLFLRLESELARSRGSFAPLTVMVCDLDEFKQVNDRIGHLKGNRVLRGVADVLRQSCNTYDYVARMGGDEFAILLPGGGRDTIVRRMSQLQGEASDALLTVAGAGPLSLSVGEAFYPQDGSDAEELLAEADRRMYKSKRNRRAGHATGIHIWTPPPAVMPQSSAVN